MIKNDLLTNEAFEPLRINQKFAHSKNRVKYYNEKANKLRHQLSNIEKPLRRNFRIVEEIMKGRDEAVFHIEFLRGKSYSMPLFTHYTEIEGVGYPAIYSYVLVVLENQQIKFIKHD